MLGLAGLLPFFAGTAWVWVARGTPGGAFAAHSLATYAATIAAFLGGLHWGPALRDGGRDVAAPAWGVTPQLAACLADWLPMRLRLMPGAVASCLAAALVSAPA
ncbi:MAG: DUF3429 domain-containing protein [Janthinobacterium lividum]